MYLDPDSNRIRTVIQQLFVSGSNLNTDPNLSWSSSPAGYLAFSFFPAGPIWSPMRPIPSFYLPPCIPLGMDASVTILPIASFYMSRCTVYRYR